MADWQPIETAPKDADVLVYLPDERTPMQVGVWRDDARGRDLTMVEGG